MPPDMHPVVKDTQGFTFLLLPPSLIICKKSANALFLSSRSLSEYQYWGVMELATVAKELNSKFQSVSSRKGALRSQCSILDPSDSNEITG